MKTVVINLRHRVTPEQYKRIKSKLQDDFGSGFRVVLLPVDIVKSYEVIA